MKTESSRKPIRNLAQFDSEKFTIDECDVGWIASILTSKLYSDKPLAVCREYMANAFDANVDNGKRDIPIIVHAPTKFKPTLRVRDFGKGLNHEEMVNTYAKYGKSTKRDSNDQIGAFGIGNLSFGCYTDAMTVISWKDGVMSTYSVQLAEDGVCRLIHVADKKSDEPSGIEIQVAIKEKDVNTFHNKLHHLAKYFAVTPTVHGLDKEVSPLEKEIEGDGWFFLKDRQEKTYGWAARSIYRDNNCEVIMGNICYKLDSNAIQNLERHDSDLLLNGRLRLVFGLGEIDIAPDRERLEMTAKTQRAIKKKLQAVRDDYTETCSSEILSQKNLYDAMMKVSDFSGIIQGVSDSLKKLKWKGAEIGKGFSIECSEGIQIAKRSRHGRWGNKIENFRVSDINKFSVCGNTVVCIDDITDGKTFINQRLKTLENQNPHQYYYVISSEKPSDLKKFMKESRLDQWGDKLVYLSKVGRTIQSSSSSSSSYSGGNGVPNKSHVPMFKFLRRSYYNRLRDAWEDVPDKDVPKNTTNIFVEVKNFHPILCGVEKDSGDLQRAVDSFEKLFNKKIEVYGVRTKDIKSLDKSWVELSKYIQQHSQIHLPSVVNIPEYQEFVAGMEISTSDLMNQMLSNIKQVEQGLNGSKFKKIMLAAKRIKFLREKYSQKHGHISKICNNGVDIRPACGKVKVEYDEKPLLERYPMLKLYEHSWNNTISKGRMGDIIDYVKLVDKTYPAKEKKVERLVDKS